MMKFGRKNFFTKRLYNGLGTLAGHSWDLLDNFYKILFINFRVLVVIFFCNILSKWQRLCEIFFAWGLYNISGTLVGAFPGISWQFPWNIDYIFSNIRTQHLMLRFAEIWWNLVDCCFSLFLTDTSTDLRVFPAETRLTVYRRCVISDLNVNFRFLFGLFFAVANDP